MEDIITKCWSIAPESDASQASAALKGPIPNADDSITNGDARQAAAPSAGKAGVQAFWPLVKGGYFGPRDLGCGNAFDQGTRRLCSGLRC
jgi:hypothetical protein